MKLIEKMARDWIRGEMGKGAALVVNHSDTHVEDGARAAYLAGFRAAREMAEKDARQVAPYHAVCCRVRGENIASNIAQLGEDEVS